MPPELLGGGVPGVPPVGPCACSAAAEGPLAVPPRDSRLAHPLLAALRFLGNFVCAYVCVDSYFLLGDFFYFIFTGTQPFVQ